MPTPEAAEPLTGHALRTRWVELHFPLWILAFSLDTLARTFRDGTTGPR